MFANPSLMLLCIQHQYEQSIISEYCFSVCCPPAAFCNKGDPALCQPSICCSTCLPVCTFEAVPLSHLDAFRRRQMASTAGLPLAPLLLTPPLPQTAATRVLQMRGEEARVCLSHTHTELTVMFDHREEDVA